MAVLPLEILYQIIDNLVVFKETDPIALKQSDWRTVELRNWSLVSKATGDHAQRHLFSHCLHITHSSQLMQLLRTLNPATEKSEANETETEPETETRQKTTPFRHLHLMRKLHLAPFDDRLDDKPTAQWVFELLSTLAPHLKRLSFNFACASLARYSDHLDVYRDIRAGLLRLEQLEELTCLDQSTNLEDGWDYGPVPFWWCNLGRLKRLALKKPCHLQSDTAGEARVYMHLPQLEYVLFFCRCADHPTPSLMEFFLGDQTEEEPLTKMLSAAEGQLQNLKI